MSDLERQLEEVHRKIKKVRKSLESTQAHAKDYVWSQIGQAVTDLKKIEREVEAATRRAKDTE